MGETMMFGTWCLEIIYSNIYVKEPCIVMIRKHLDPKIRIVDEHNNFVEKESNYALVNDK